VRRERGRKEERGIEMASAGETDVYAEFRHVDMLVVSFENRSFEFLYKIV
jgi:hypothetical protein